ncbi:MAG: M14 family metallopeptidase [Marinilabiliaceae bacterium]|nr:M14 family metallopeptidase [Marinilabiliaceae bacterium]
MISLMLLLPLNSMSQKVPISFNKYHGFSGTLDYLKKVNNAYPDITELIKIGESNYGRPVYVLVISNMKTGTTIDRHIKLYNKRKENVDNVPEMKIHQGKPGHFISGSTHGNEYTGTEVCLYIIDKLVSGYGSSEEITELIDKKAFYICPVINPDGVFNSVEKGIAQRANSMKIDNDNDGQINEDGPDDLNGDGFITSFRYKDDKGSYILDESDSRIMVRLGRNQETEQQRYSLIAEDLDNDKDGKRGEDPEAGIDLNRNYPEGWWNDQGFAGGSGDYPTSAPESHAIAEFFSTYRNILMAQFYHTSGGFTYRPMGTAPHTRMNSNDVAVFDLVMGKKYLEIIGEEIPEAWENPGKISELKKILAGTDADKYTKMRGYELPRGWRVSYNEKADRRYGYGMATDWLYAQYGIYSITTELWNPLADIPGLSIAEGDDSQMAREKALLKYQEDEYGGDLFIDWKAFKHPELGEGEIGGWKSQYARNNAFPGKPLLKVCEDHWQFELFRAKLLPEIAIKDIKTEILYSGNASEGSVSVDNNSYRINSGNAKGKYHIIRIKATVENTGELGTNLAAADRLPGNREDVVWLVGDKGSIEFLEGQPFKSVGSLGGVLNVPGTGKQDSSAELEWIIALKDKSDLKLIVSSLKGGTVVKNISIK